MGDVTFLLQDVQPGDPDAAAELLPLVYDELRRLAAHRLAHEAAGQTLDPTALVHEAYLRIIRTQAEAHWDNRGHFFAAVAEAMRRILVENSRSKRSAKRGGGWTRQPVDEAELLVPEPREDLVALDEALKQLVVTDPGAAELVQLRYFGGLSIPEAAEVLAISPRTANRLWTYARAWLYEKINGHDQDAC